MVSSASSSARVSARVSVAGRLTTAGTPRAHTTPSREMTTSDGSDDTWEARKRVKREAEGVLEKEKNVPGLLSQKHTPRRGLPTWNKTRSTPFLAPAVSFVFVHCLGWLPEI